MLYEECCRGSTDHVTGICRQRQVNRKLGVAGPLFSFSINYITSMIYIYIYIFRCVRELYLETSGSSSPFFVRCAFLALNLQLGCRLLIGPFSGPHSRSSPLPSPRLRLNTRFIGIVLWDPNLLRNRPGPRSISSHDAAFLSVDPCSLWLLSAEWEVGTNSSLRSATSVYLLRRFRRLLY